MVDYPGRAAHASPIDIAGDEIVRDEFGNPKGGARSPYVNLLTVRYLPAVHGLIGLQEPIPPDKLRLLYGWKEDCFWRFNEGIDELEAECLLFPRPERG